jgi:RNA polymerase sigma factor (sigma-70 family)
MEDKLLVLRCKRGSRHALGRIYEKYKNNLLILAMALLNDVNAAEDAVHDVFVSFVQSIEKFQLTGSLKGYLLTCVANCARNKLRARHQQNARFREAKFINNSSANEPSQLIIANESLQLLGSAMAQLPYEQREVIMLRLQASMTFKAIAKLQGISVNTVKSRYKYGLDRLRSALDEEVKK